MPEVTASIGGSRSRQDRKITEASQLHAAGRASRSGYLLAYLYGTSCFASPLRSAKHAHPSPSILRCYCGVVPQADVPAFDRQRRVLDISSSPMPGDQAYGRFLLDEKSEAGCPRRSSSLEATQGALNHGHSIQLLRSQSSGARYGTTSTSRRLRTKSYVELALNNLPTESDETLFRIIAGHSATALHSLTSTSAPRARRWSANSKSSPSTRTAAVGRSWHAHQQLSRAHRHRGNPRRHCLTRSSSFFLRQAQSPRRRTPPTSIAGTPHRPPHFSQ